MLSIELIAEVVARSHGLPMSALFGKFRRYSGPRHEAIYLALLLRPTNYSEVGRAYLMDHSSVMYVERKMIDKLNASPALRQRIHTLTVAIQEAGKSTHRFRSTQDEALSISLAIANSGDELTISRASMDLLAREYLKLSNHKGTI